MTSRSLGHRAPLLWLILPFVVGLAAAKFADLPPTPWLLWAALPPALLAAWASWRAERWWAPALATAMALVGAADYTLNRARLPEWETRPAREVRVALRVERTFSSGDQNRSSGLGIVTQADEHLRELVGQRFYFSLNLKKGQPAPTRSTVLRLAGVLQSLPREAPANSFDGYLASTGANFRLIRGQVLAEEQPATWYYRFCARAADRFREILSLGITANEPRLAALLRAMMLGETQVLTPEQRTLFMESGTMHLFAISGLNIGVVAGTLHLLLGWMRLPRWARFAISTVLLWLFVDITGGSPSAVRSFAMVVFLQGALVLKRPGSPLAALVASAFVVLLVSPLQLSSASFLMSYSIVAALLVLGLPLSEAWMERWQPWRDLPPVTWNWWQRGVEIAWRWAASAFAIGLATTLVSLVTGLQYFHLLTPGAFLTNLVLIPTAMLATLAGFASLLLGLVGLSWAAVACNYVAAYVLLFIEWLVRLSVRLPGAFLPAKFTAEWIGPAALLTLMGILIAGYATGWKRKAGGWWAPFALVAVVLAVGVQFGAA
jgi:competence protein ComEC